MAVLFLAIIILGTIIIINSSGSSKTETTITNSFNTYNINVNNINSAPLQGYNYADSIPIRYANNRDITTKTTQRNLYYNSWSNEKIISGIFDNQIKEYSVYVKNQDYVGGYFKVVYYFEDYYGNVDSYPVTYYIGPQKQKEFVYKDVSPSEHKHRNWWYEIDSLTKAPIKK